MPKWLIGTCCLALAVSACGGGNAADQPEGAVTGLSATDEPTRPVEDTLEPSPSTSAAAAVGSATTGTDPCDLLSVADVVAATGLEVLEAHNEPPISCVFDLGPDGTEAIFVSLEDGEGRSIGPAAVFDSYVELVAAGDAQEISGVGEQAIFAPSYRGLVVDVGQGDFIALGVNGGYGALSEPRDVLISLARSVLSRL